MTTGRGTPRAAWAVIGAYAAVQAALLARHEMWRDETAAWITVAATQSFADFVAALEYGGHPPLWYAVLELAHGLWASPTMLQLVAWTIAVATVAVVVLASPFTMRQRALLVFGYFPLYEYGTLARGYGLGMLLGLVACMLYARRERHALAMGIVLALLANTTVFGTILALAFAGLLALDLPDATYRRTSLMSIAGTAVGAAVAVAFLVPPADSGFATEWFTALDATRLMMVPGAFVNAWLPLPDIMHPVWGRSLFVEPQWRVLGALCIAAVAVGLVRALRSSPRALWFLALACVGTTAFLYLKYFGSPRHHGTLFVATIMALWLAAKHGAHASRTLGGRGLDALLALHVVAALVVAVTDLRAPFSRARDVATYLQREGLREVPIAAYPDYSAASVITYAGVPTVYFPQGEREGSWVRYDAARAAPLTDAEVFCRAQAHARVRGGRMLLLTDRALDVDVTPLVRFDGAMADGESFVLTWVDAASTPPSLSCSE